MESSEAHDSQVPHRSSLCACAGQLYVKDVPVEYRRDVCKVSGDDKHKAPVGNHEHVALIDRTGGGLVPQGVDLAAASSDYTRFSIIPSMNLIIDIPPTR